MTVGTAAPGPALVARALTKRYGARAALNR